MLVGLLALATAETLALVESQLARLDVELVRRVGNMRNLGISGLGGRRGDRAGKTQRHCDTRGDCDGPVSFRVRVSADEDPLADHWMARAPERFPVGSKKLRLDIRFCRGAVRPSRFG